jgi:predicted phosphate transport protein (TIGR00153 family)
MGFQTIIKWFLPKEDKFYEILEKQGNLTHETAIALSLFSDGTKTNSQISESIQFLEHEGDRLVFTIEEALAKTFVTPIDREDIHNLSIELDDVIDFCNQAARSAVLFNVTKPTDAMVKLTNILVKCTQHLSEVIPSLRKANFENFYKIKNEVRVLEKEADKIYREEISNIFASTITDNFKNFFSQKEVLNKLENAIDRCEDILQLLVNLAVKHG